ncbi:lipoprotein [Acidithiobacillus thiooxidans]|uniref:lipoprotein n=1 Tax=Acidithiobacillus thiooxidans TaxID=930 RepID=UPI001301895B
MKKTTLIFLLVVLLSGCAGYDGQYPLCSVLPAGSAGCPPSLHVSDQSRSGSGLPFTP